MPEQHTILGGKVYVYKRPNSRLWQCSTYFAGKNRRISTKEESLSKAKEIAEGWYLQLRGKLRSGEIKSEKTFREASEHYLREYDIITQGQRNQRYVEGQHWRSRLHLARLRLRPTSHANLQPNKSLARRLRCTQSPATCGTMNPRTPRHSASRNPGAGPTRQPPPLAT